MIAGQEQQATPLTLLSVRRDKGRAILSLSNGETLAMPRAMLKERPYRGGTPFDKDAFTAFLKNRSYSFAMDRAVSLLAVRARTQKELRDSLAQCAYPGETIECVLRYLADAGYVDDADFASRWAASRASKGLGARRIQLELRRKGVDADTIEHTMDELDDDAQLEAALLSARKAARGKNLDSAQDRQKVLAALARRGFGFSLAKQALERIYREES